MCSFSSTCPGIFITFGSRSSVFAKSTEQTAEDFLRRRSRSVHSGPFQGTTSRWMETPCYTCLGPLPRPGDWKRHPVEVMEHNEAKRTFAASPTSSRALENSWRFLKASRRTRRWKCVSSFCPQHGSFFIISDWLVSSNYIYTRNFVTCSYVRPFAFRLHSSSDDFL